MNSSTRQLVWLTWFIYSVCSVTLWNMRVQPEPKQYTPRLIRMTKTAYWNVWIFHMNIIFTYVFLLVWRIRSNFSHEFVCVKITVQECFIGWMPVKDSSSVSYGRSWHIKVQVLIRILSQWHALIAGRKYKMYMVQV